MFLSSLNQEQKEVFFRLAYSVVVSDGEMTGGEKRMLDEMRREMNLAEEVVPVYQDIQGVEKIFDSRASRTIALISMIRLGFADEAYEIEEQCYINDVRKAFEFADKDFNCITNWVTRLVSLEQEVQAFMS